MEKVLPKVYAECKCANCSEITKIEVDLAYPGGVIQAVVHAALNDVATGLYDDDVFMCATCFDAYMDKYGGGDDAVERMLSDLDDDYMDDATRYAFGAA